MWPCSCLSAVFVSDLSSVLLMILRLYNRFMCYKQLVFLLVSAPKICSAAGLVCGVSGSICRDLNGNWKVTGSSHGTEQRIENGLERCQLAPWTQEE